jgi:hypothetical protein
MRQEEIEEPAEGARQEREGARSMWQVEKKGPAKGVRSEKMGLA